MHGDTLRTRTRSAMRPANRIEPPIAENEHPTVTPQPKPSLIMRLGRNLTIIVVVVYVAYFCSPLLRLLPWDWIWTPAEHEFSVEVSSTKSDMTFTFGDGTQMNLILIPAGEFVMGAPQDEEGRASWDGPQRRVTISKSFYMGVYEVTQEQYEAVMGKNESAFQHSPKNPVENISWNDAIEFCRKLLAKTNRDVDLPTEAQWEYACRAGSTTPFNVGKTISGDQANYMGTRPCGCGCTGDKPCIDRDMTVPVGTFKPNSFGLYDMHGNVHEWCRDWYGVALYTNAKNNVDPENTTEARDRIFRGGSWIDGPEDCRSAARAGECPDYFSASYGFRVIVRQSIEGNTATRTDSMGKET